MALVTDGEAVGIALGTAAALVAAGSTIGLAVFARLPSAGGRTAPATAGTLPGRDRAQPAHPNTPAPGEEPNHDSRF